jgi:hypothetical protein
MALQAGAQRLEQSLLGLQRRAATTEERLAVIKAARGGGADPARHR